MKIIHYCQYIWGVGHFFRSLEICRALAGHDVLLVTGGPKINALSAQESLPMKLT